MDDERLKNLGGGSYWQELLTRIHDIRASEKVFYRQVLDIYATSIDYAPKADTSVLFFKKVQNKMHFAVHGQTAAEVIYSRADAEKVFMGLTTFSGDKPTLQEALMPKIIWMKGNCEPWGKSFQVIWTSQSARPNAMNR